MLIVLNDLNDTVKGCLKIKIDVHENSLWFYSKSQKCNTKTAKPTNVYIVNCY